MICRKEILVNTYNALITDRKFSTHAQRIQGDFALNQFVVHLALVTRSIAGPGNQASIYQSQLLGAFGRARKHPFIFDMAAG